jgi:sugar lactone lactonase YvrE
MPRRVGTQRDILGECPLWDDDAQCLWWEDIRAPALRRWNLRSSLHSPQFTSWALPELVGSIALTDEPPWLLVALSSRLTLFHPERGTLETLAEPHFADANHRFNDGRCDRAGRFWVGSINNVTRAPEGHLYRFDLASGLSSVARGICIPNSLAFSPDGRTMYFADSLAHRIDAVDYDAASGTRGTARPFAHSVPPAFPDGSCVDAEGHLWNAEFHAARVVRYAPDGRVSRVIELPVRRPTCCTFGGAALDTLYITTTSQQMSAAELAAEPLAGALLALEPGVRGLPEPRFALRGARLT